MTGVPEASFSFDKTHDLANQIVQDMAEANVEVGYCALACALVIARIFSVEKNLSDEQEVKFIEDLTDWVGAYFGDTDNAA